MQPERTRKTSIFLQLAVRLSKCPVRFCRIGARVQMISHPFSASCYKPNRPVVERMSMTTDATNVYFKTVSFFFILFLRESLSINYWGFSFFFFFVAYSIFVRNSSYWPHGPCSPIVSKNWFCSILKSLYFVRFRIYIKTPRSMRRNGFTQTRRSSRVQIHGFKPSSLLQFRYRRNESVIKCFLLFFEQTTGNRIQWNLDSILFDIYNYTLVCNSITVES